MLIYTANKLINSINILQFRHCSLDFKIELLHLLLAYDADIWKCNNM